MDAFAPDESAIKTITISSSSQRVKIFEGSGAARARVPVRIANLGTAVVWIKSGDVTVTATNAGLAIPAGAVEVLRFPVPETGPLYIAAIAAGSTGDITLVPGDGI